MSIVKMWSFLNAPAYATTVYPSMRQDGELYKYVTEETLSNFMLFVEILSRTRYNA